jgi:SAM-dependent methyltransferase
MGMDVVGIEPGEDLRRRARANNVGVTIEDGDIENLPFPDESFDAVLAIEVLRHLPGPKPAIHEIHRILRPGGLAIVTAAPRWSLTGYALINMVTSRVSIPTFTKSRQTFLSERAARQLLEAAGYSSVEVHGVMLGPWQVVQRISPKLLAVLLKAFEPIDDFLSDRKYFRDLGTQLVLIGRR